MVLSEAEALARLEVLRRQRDAIERQIADFLLYLDLGRRLGSPASPDADGRADAPIPVPAPAPQPVQAPAAAPPVPPSAAPERPAAPAVPAPAEEEAGLSETVLARRYGRAVIEAVLAVLEEAGRPMHASEILARITEQGFALPGQDPVAALNTRLWKRSGPGGPLKRLGEAVYAPADAEEA